MDAEERRAAKARLVAGMPQGHSWQEAVSAAGLSLGRSAAYRLTQRVQVLGEGALHDQRHGHPSKLRAPVQQRLEAYCRSAPRTPSREVQAALRERFGLSVSISHLNRVRARLGLDTNHGYGKTPVINSENAKRRAAVEQRLAALQRKAAGARRRAAEVLEVYAR